MLHKHFIKEAGQKVRKAMFSDRAIRQGGRDIIRELDHQLQFVCDGLTLFRPRSGTASVPLMPHEERYEVLDKRPRPADLPDDVEPKRICIKDSRSGQCRFEVSDFSLQRPLLSIWADEGPRDTPAFWFLAARSYRMLFFFDPLHRITRDLCLAAKSADMWSMVLDTTI